MLLLRLIRLLLLRLIRLLLLHGPLVSLLLRGRRQLLVLLLHDDRLDMLRCRVGDRLRREQTLQNGREALDDLRAGRAMEQLD